MSELFIKGEITMCRASRVFAVLCSILCLMVTTGYSDVKAAEKNNDYTIVFVHGFAGWGTDEMKTMVGNIPYWGGIVTDIEGVLKENGHKVLVASIGPVSSNWDRACELYAQIVNAPRVDYGKAHSEDHGHERFVPNKYYRYDDQLNLGKENKVHIIAHSMGAPTSRYLIQLLEEGSGTEMAEKAKGGYDDISPLFDPTKDTKGIVCSLTTLAGATNGTTLASVVDDLFPYAQDLVVTIGSAVGGFMTNDPLYDFDLEQFGLKRMSGESWSEYVEKVRNSSVWNTEDTCLKDLSVEGMAEAHEWLKPVVPDVYYFSYSTQQTFDPIIGFTDHHIPTIHMAPYLAAFAYKLGKFSMTLKNGEKVDKSWWANDGVVNTISQKYPFVNYKQSEIAGTHAEGLPSNPAKGKWYHVQTLDSDHEDVVGLGFDLTSQFGRKKGMDDFYLGIVKTLEKLD